MGYTNVHWRRALSERPPPPAPFRPGKGPSPYMIQRAAPLYNFPAAAVVSPDRSGVLLFVILIAGAVVSYVGLWSVGFIG